MSALFYLKSLRYPNTLQQKLFCHIIQNRQYMSLKNTQSKLRKQQKNMEK